MCIWHPEADSLDFNNDALNIVFRNNCINNYLKKESSLGIAGIKGQGKTFLIKAKRKALGKDYILIPKDSVMIDTLDIGLKLQKNKINFLSSYTNWVLLWKAAIFITVLQTLKNKEIISYNNFSELTLNFLNRENKDSRTSVVFYDLLEKNSKELNQIFVDIPRLSREASKIHSQVAIFIDKIDQAFAQHFYRISGDTPSSVGTRNASIWQYSQLSLANAAYDIYCNTNKHIKVYFTIRQEALLDAEEIAPNSYRNFSAYITKIDYSKNDLYDMFCLYVYNENDLNLNNPSCKKNNPEKAFVGMDVVRHGYNNCHKEEKLFDYIYRHTTGRASDIQQICYDLYIHNVKGLDENSFKRYVNGSARSIMQQYIAELQPISLMSRNEICALLEGITTNIFDYDYMKKICRRYMLKQKSQDSCKMNCKICDEVYPFARLYNIGLLGYLYNNQSNSNIYEQRFVSPSNRIIRGGAVNIETSQFYILHPCISDMAREQRKSLRRKYSNSEYVIAGNSCLVEADLLSQLKTELDKEKDNLKEELTFVSSTMKTLEDIRKGVEKSLLQKGYYPVIYENTDYQTHTKVFSHDDCIDKILECGNIVTIFDKLYGGEYAGIKYKKEVEEIRQKSKGNIEHPSITLMEYYVARKYGKKYLTLMNKAIPLHADTKEYKGNKRKIWKNKTDLDKMVSVMNFINKLKISNKDEVPIGNTIRFYKDITEIKEIISNNYFD